jgi:ubiquinone/menaquinone biosynthesis C-methylase UbiE
MPQPRFVLKQLARPSGFLGRLVARVLNKRNHADNHATLDVLELTATSRVLDVGFGGGVSFPRLLRACSEGVVAGVDISPSMVARAKRKWARDVNSGRLDVRVASVEELPWPSGSFDRVLSANTIYFWPDVPAGLAELRRVLVDGGELGLLCASTRTLEQPGFSTMGFRIKSGEEYAAELERAGFNEVEVIERDDGHGTHILSATNPG